jgi:hypothetical protein
MSFLRRLFGGGSADEAPAPEPSGAPGGPVDVADPERTLADYVGRLVARPELEFLIVEWDSARRLYIQFAPEASGGLLAESVGDRYLEPRHRLSDDQRDALRALGWSEAMASGNWQRTWPAGTEPAAVASVCTATMEVYGVAARPQWTITFGAD